MRPMNTPGQTGGSPVQSHPIQIVTEAQWITGNIETLGEANFYINQEGIANFRISNCQLYPWAFTGLPATEVNQIIVNPRRIQMLMFTQPETINQLRRPPRTETLVFYLPLLVVQGKAPMMGDAKLVNFMDAWKGDFVPILEANLHFLSENATQLPETGQVIYLNRHLIQSYLQN